MTLEELQTAANNGDINAMISLGENCLETKTVNSFIAAINWFAMAAKEGNAFAALKASATSADVAETCMSHSICGRETFEFWQKTTLHALDAMKDPSPDSFDPAMKLLEKGLLGMAYLQYLNNQSSQAIGTLKSIDTPTTPQFTYAVKLLKAVCVIEVSDDAPLGEIFSVFNSVFCDKEYIALISDASILEQMIFSCGANMYAAMLRRGAGMTANPQLADAVLNLAYNSLSEEAAKKPLLPRN